MCRYWTCEIALSTQRLLFEPLSIRFAGGARYSGPLACAAAVWRGDGVAGFFKGWSASYARLGPHTVIMFLTAEQLRQMAGLKSL